MPEGVAADLLATLREALSNVAKHADARAVEVSVDANDGVVTVTVTDDGVGPPDGAKSPGRGLANMAARAERHGGTLEVRAAPAGGTNLVWQVPIRDG